MWESVKNCSSVCKEVGTRGWISRVAVAASCQIEAHVPSMPEAEASRQLFTTGQKYQLARPFARGLNSRLNPVARSSRHNILFGKIWVSHSFSPYYIYTLIPTIQIELPERILREKTKLTHPQFLPERLFKFLCSLPLNCKILERLITKTFSHHIHFCERAVWCFGKQLGRNKFHIG